MWVEMDGWKKVRLATLSATRAGYVANQRRGIPRTLHLSGSVFQSAGGPHDTIRAMISPLSSS
jgi:hypothetical protein